MGDKALNRTHILKETADLFDANCVGCKKWEIAAKQKHHKKAQEYCERQCDIGKRLMDLGDFLTYGRPTKTARDLIKEVYLEEREKGLFDKEIQKKYKINHAALVFRKRHWGLIKNKSKRHLITKEQYLIFKAQRLSDEWICKKVGIHPSTLGEYKKSWEVKAGPDLNAIQEGPNGEEISAVTYLKYKGRGWSDDMIINHWMIGRTTLQRKKRAWRKAGYDIDLYNSHKIPASIKKGDTHGITSSI
jgi:hypothetical protein